MPLGERQDGPRPESPPRDLNNTRLRLHLRQEVTRRPTQVRGSITIERSYLKAQNQKEFGRITPRKAPTRVYAWEQKVTSRLTHVREGIMAK